MARTETVIGVFVASPSDVSEERKALESVALELNKTWSKNLNLRLDLIKWESDIHPGFGDYPQDVINNQINDEYDVFVAIFWGKIGRQTKIAESGTVEEFERAYKKYKKDKNSVDIMVYFKDKAISPSKMDFEQLQKIQSLKKQLGEKGGLYWTFENTEDFESLLRSHLSKIAQKWSSKTSISLTQQPSKLQENDFIGEVIELDNEDYGLFDYLEIYEDRIFDMNAALSSMAEATEKIGSQFNKRTKEINTLTKEDGKTDTKKTRKIIKLSSDDMERYSEIMESQIIILSKSREESFNALSKALSVLVDFKNEDSENELSDLEKSLEGMRDAACGTIEGLSTFRETISSLPRLTIQLNKAKRRAVRALDNMLEEVKSTVQSSINVLKIIDELIKK